MLSPLLFPLYINGLVVELKRKWCGAECGGLLIPGLLSADDSSLFGEDVEGLEQSLMALEEWGEICHHSFQEEIVSAMGP